MAAQVVVSLGLALDAPAAAQFRRITGISVTPTGGMGLTADFDLAMTTTGSPLGVWSTLTYYGRPAPPYRGQLGDRYSLHTYGGFGTPARAEIILVDPQVNAIEFGSPGSVPVAGTTLSAVTPGTPGAYRGSFSHTYPAPGDYTVRVGAVFNFQYTLGGAPQTITNGNPVVVATGSPLVYTSNFFFYSSTGTATIPFTYSTTAPGQTVGITNTAVVSPGSFQVIPTASEIGLIALAVVLGTAGVLLLRR
jgi:hypothetical protein